MDQKRISHDIENDIARLKVMHDIAKEKKFDLIPKDELEKDLQSTLEDLKEKFALLLQ